MNTLDDKTPYEEININNFPINKWVHVALTIKQKDLDVFINGRLKKNIF